MLNEETISCDFQSIKLIEEATVADPKCEFAQETLGTIEVQRGNLLKAVEHFDKAIPLCNTELEMAHLFGLVGFLEPYIL